MNFLLAFFVAYISVSFTIGDISVPKELQWRHGITGSYKDQWDIYDLVDQLGLKNFQGLLEQTGFMYQLGDDNAGPFTVYAPTDEAFDNLPPSILKKLQNDDNWDFVYDLVSYHVTRGNLSFSKWRDNLLVPTYLKTSKIRLNLYKNDSGEISTLTADGCVLTKPDQIATNGIVQVISRVMFKYPTGDLLGYISLNNNLSILAKILHSGGYPKYLTQQNLTFFAPSNKAFERRSLYPGILANQTDIDRLFSSHLINNTFYEKGIAMRTGAHLTNINNDLLSITSTSLGIAVNGVNLTRTDISVNNGVVHIINDFLIPVISST